jgi:hypothetical protein
VVRLDLPAWFVEVRLVDLALGVGEQCEVELREPHEVAETAS